MKLLNIVSKPVSVASHGIVKWLHRRAGARQLLLPFAHRHWMRRILHSRRTYELILGFVLMFWAGHLYHSPPHFLNSEFWEMSAFGIHGLGAAPIIKMIGEAIGIDV